MTPALISEGQARQQIDAMLVAAGWRVQDRRHLNLHAAPGVALCESDVKSRGSLPRALALFGRERLPVLLEELNTTLAA